MVGSSGVISRVELMGICQPDCEDEGPSRNGDGQTIISVGPSEPVFHDGLGIDRLIKGTSGITG